MPFCTKVNSAADTLLFQVIRPAQVPEIAGTGDIDVRGNAKSTRVSRSIETVFSNER